jgi:hypothetical protein
MLTRRKSLSSPPGEGQAVASALESRPRGLFGKRGRSPRPVTEHDVRQSLQALVQCLSAQADLRGGVGVLGARSLETDVAERLTAGMSAMLPHKGLYLHLRCVCAPAISAAHAAHLVVVCDCRIKGLPSFEIRLGAMIEGLA